MGACLPQPLTSFIGREAEVAEIARLLAGARMVTLIGAGGIGKTRLALEVGRCSEAAAGIEVALIELAPLRDAALVSRAVGAGLGMPQRGASMLGDVVVALQSRRLLLLLDNCEHLVAACADIAATILRRCPEVRILATSREVLGVEGEVIVRVAPLDVPAETSVCGPTEVAAAAAGRLFVEGAQRARAEFVLDAQNAAHVARICRRLDGIPLAIELAAARVRMLEPEEIAVRLDDRFRLLVGGSRTAPPRHQTLRAAVDWSYDLLEEGDRRLFEHLAVFAGGWDLEAAETVCLETRTDTENLGSVFDGLTRLVDRSLVLVERPADGRGATRYDVLETLRAYGLEHLENRREGEKARARHAAWLVDRAERAAAAFWGSDQGYWLRWAEREHDNIRAALAWLIQTNQVDNAQRLAGSLWWSWLVHQRANEGLDWLLRVLGLAGSAAPTRARGELLDGAASLAISVGEVTSTRVQRWLLECLAVGQRTNDAALTLAAQGWLMLLRQFGIDVEGVAVVTLEELLEASRRIKHHFGEVRGLAGLAQRALHAGDSTGALDLQEQAIQVARTAGDAWSLANALSELGDMQRTLGEHALAGARYAESLASFADLGLARQPSLLHNLGYVALAEGETTRAWTRFIEALRQFRQQGDAAGMAECLIGLGAVTGAAGRAGEAVKLLAAGEAALEASGRRLWPSNQADRARWSAHARRALSPSAFARACREGQQWPLVQAVAWVSERGPAGATVPLRQPEEVARLTRREVEVAQLAAQGLTNRQIAEALVIAERTAANHLQHSLEKLGLHSRVQLAASVALHLTS